MAGKGWLVIFVVVILVFFVTSKISREDEEDIYGAVVITLIKEIKV